MEKRIGNWAALRMCGKRGIGETGQSLRSEVSDFARACCGIDPDRVDLTAATREFRETLNAQIAHCGYRVKGNDLYRVSDDAWPLSTFIETEEWSFADYEDVIHSNIIGGRDGATE